MAVRIAVKTKLIKDNTMKLKTIKIVKIVIIGLSILSLLYTYVEYYNYEHEYNRSKLIYRDGIYNNYKSMKELYEGSVVSPLLIKYNRLEQILYINSVNFILILVYFYVNRRGQKITQE